MLLADNVLVSDSPTTYKIDCQGLQRPDVGRFCPVCAEQCSFRGFLQPQEQVLFGDAKLRLGLQWRDRRRCRHAHSQDQGSA